MRDRVWICRDGTRILVADMETSHIRSALRLMARRPGWRAEYRERLLLELTIRAMGRSSGRTG